MATMAGAMPIVASVVLAFSPARYGGAGLEASPLRWRWPSGQPVTLALAFRPAASLLANTGLPQRVVRGQHEQRSIRFGADDVLKAIGRVAGARIAVLREHEQLEVG